MDIISCILKSCGILAWIIFFFSHSGFNSGSKTYETNFSLDENPISEKGNWINGGQAGLDWKNVKTVNGIAKGLPNYPDWWRDGTALLKGNWGPDQTVTATVWCNNQHNDDHLEVEIRLRSSLSLHSCTGYEVLFNCKDNRNGYLYIVRWNGPEHDFNILEERKGPDWAVRDGDVVKATIIGNIVTAYINGEVKLTAQDTVFKNGNPGMGFDNYSNGGNEDIGFSNFTAKSFPVAGRINLSLVSSKSIIHFFDPKLMKN